MAESATTITPEIALIIRNERPIAAADLGALLTALSADYRRLNKGRTLVVAGLETGSLIARLREAYATLAPYGASATEILQAAKNLATFVTLLKGLIGSAKDDPKHGKLFRKGRGVGIRSAERLLQTAMKTEGEVEVLHRQPNGEELFIRVTAVEAVRIRERKPDPLFSISAGDNGLVSSVVIPTFQGFKVDDVIAATESDVSRAEAIFKALASVLRESGLGYDLLELVAERLEWRGQLALAAAARAHIKSRP